MTTDDPQATVQRMFEAFGRGDLDGLLETVHPDSRWTYVGANPRPTKAVLVGKEGARKFFGNILRNLDMTAFQPTEYVIQDNTVVVFGFETGTLKLGGKPFRNEWAQKYVVQDGLITEMEEYNIQVDSASRSESP